jgi:hypothetical protein
LYAALLPQGDNPRLIKLRPTALKLDGRNVVSTIHSSGLAETFWEKNEVFSQEVLWNLVYKLVAAV